jgi:hypothetical protein
LFPEIVVSSRLTRAEEKKKAGESRSPASSLASALASA